MTAQVLDDGAVTAVYPVSNGVKQGYLLEQTLLKLMFTVMLSDIFRGGDDNIYTNNRTDGGTFNLRSL